MLPNPRTLLAIASAAVLTAPALAAKLKFEIQTLDGQTSVSANSGCTLRYRILGTLIEASPETPSDGLALWACDLALNDDTGTPAISLPRANRPPTGGTMSAFDIPNGISNPPVDATYASGYGGTQGVMGTAEENKLLQVGGAQNTIKNSTAMDASRPPFPVGDVAGSVAQSAQVLLIGTVTLPMVSPPVTYTLTASNIIANVIRDGELGPPAPAFYKTEPVAAVDLTNLTINVVSAAQEIRIVAANPPLAIDNPYQYNVPFRDALQTGTSTTQVTQGIGANGTPALDSISYAPISVTFSCEPFPVPSTSNITIACTGPGTYVCPTISGVSGSGGGPYTITLSGAIPPKACTTLTFAGTASGEKLQYQSLPADVNLTGQSSTSDLLALVAAINAGQTGPQHFARYDVNRNAAVGATDILRLNGLLNGTNTTEAWLGAVVSACP